MPRMVGANVKARTQSLFNEMEAWYTVNNVPVDARLNKLTPLMIQQQGQSPKLRASAAEMRKLVPFLHDMSQRFLNDLDPVEAAAKCAALHLNECYKCLSEDAIFYHTSLTEHSTAFALQAVALAQAHAGTRLWRIKPKLHHFLELCSEGTKPSRCWTYRGEDYGGSCARTIHRRGGKISAKAVSSNLLVNFRIKQPIIRIR